jgi:hypothetical protein
MEGPDNEKRKCCTVSARARREKAQHSAVGRIAQACSEPLERMGNFPLKGVGAEQPIYALRMEPRAT